MSHQQHTLQTQTLAGLINQLQLGLIEIPYYQRARLWNSQRRQGWAKSIREEIVVPTFVMYDINGTGAYYLADGMQRLSTTVEILEHPEQYRFESKNDVLWHLNRCTVSVAILHLESHQEGYQHFVNLNARGMALSPTEVFKGVMLNPDSPESSWVYEHLLIKVTERIGDLVKWKHSHKIAYRDQSAKELRGVLALFAQYSTKTNRVDFWSVAQKHVSVGETQVEEVLSNFLLGRGLDEVAQMVNDFIKTVFAFSSICENHIHSVKPKDYQLGDYPLTARIKGV